MNIKISILTICTLYLKLDLQLHIFKVLFYFLQFYGKKSYNIEEINEVRDQWGMLIRDVLPNLS